jgi:hypothetical protein
MRSIHFNVFNLTHWLNYQTKSRAATFFYNFLEFLLINRISIYKKTKDLVSLDKYGESKDSV